MPESAHDYEYADALPDGQARGRGATLNPANRYEATRLHVLGEFLDDEVIAARDDDEAARDLPSADESEGDHTSREHAAPAPAANRSPAAHATPAAAQPRQVKTVVYRDRTRTIINRVSEHSVDIPFNYSINPYRGCEHGCVYCYARPDHERLGFSCGLDFETRIMAKPDAPALLRKELSSPRWQPKTIALSGVTDCYQPIERHLRITRGLLEVMAECRQPVGIVTKSRLVTRDIDLLAELARQNAARVAISITTLQKDLAMKMEPRASTPGDRLKAIGELRAAGVPVVVMVAPIVPGLTDRDMPAILEAAADAGAQSAGFVMLRLPWQLKGLFLDWLKRHYPDRAARVESLIRQMRGGELYNASTVTRQRGEGPLAEQIAGMFKLYRKRFGLDADLPSLSAAAFRRPREDGRGQMNLF